MSLKPYKLIKWKEIYEKCWTKKLYEQGNKLGSLLELSSSGSRMGLYCLSVLLISAVIQSSAFDTWPQNLQIVNEALEVILKCETEQKNVIWKQNHVNLKSSDFKVQNPLTIVVEDQPDTGNYSCWSQENKLLNFTYVVIDATKRETSGIHCHTNTYVNSTLHCTWNIHRQLSALPLVRAKVKRNGFKDFDWVYVKARKNQSKVTFDLPNIKFCPFEDDYQNLTVTLEALSPHIYVSDYKSMLFREIVKPDRPQNVAIQEQGELRYITWEYPSSWARPHSFFPLLFEIEEDFQGHFLNNPKKFMIDEGKTKLEVSHNLKYFRLRCRDLFINSSWSEWTEWTHA
ncbi:interleukin-12 subunit beta-like [Rhinatrema bivittatum]|uniref:interleukin-12 subunit beta-like n=1 Tax=Rhinatrema bivittatum TaxID=194408 RepID=UPI00112D8935|nr:interleukin-12 subunit beta-like [Rhinatrema bivittatum]